MCTLTPIHEQPIKFDASAQLARVQQLYLDPKVREYLCLILLFIYSRCAKFVRAASAEFIKFGYLIIYFFM
jgi:hypothetical protein